MIENRRAERKDVNIDAEIVAGVSCYNGTIENISSTGVCLQFVTESNDNAHDFLPASKVTIRFKLPSGDYLQLDCITRWINMYPESPGVLVNQLGILIVSPPQALKDFIDALP